MRRTKSKMPCLPGLRPVRKLVQATAVRNWMVERSPPEAPPACKRARVGRCPWSIQGCSSVQGTPSRPMTQTRWEGGGREDCDDIVAWNWICEGDKPQGLSSMAWGAFNVSTRAPAMPIPHQLTSPYVPLKPGHFGNTDKRDADVQRGTGGTRGSARIRMNMPRGQVGATRIPYCATTGRNTEYATRAFADSPNAGLAIFPQPTNMLFS